MSTVSMAMKVHNKVEQLPAACWTTDLGILGLAGTSSPKIYCALAECSHVQNWKPPSAMTFELLHLGNDAKL